MTSLHLFKLAFKKRQISVRPVFDDVRDLTLFFSGASACLAVARRDDLSCVCRFFPVGTRCLAQKLDKRLHRLLGSKMLLDSRAAVAPIVHSQFGVLHES